MAKINRRAVAGALAALAIVTSNAVPGMARGPAKPAVPAVWVSKGADPQCQLNEKNSTQRKSRWCLAGLCRSGDPTPRKICYNYTTGEITSSNVEGPAAPIAPNTPITVEVTGVNFYRMSGKITIQQDTFSDNIKVPDLIAQNVLGTAKPGATDKSKAAAVAQPASSTADSQEAVNLLKTRLSEVKVSPKQVAKGKVQPVTSEQLNDAKVKALKGILDNASADTRAIQEPAHQVLAIAQSKGLNVDAALLKYSQQVDASITLADAKKRFGKSLVAFNGAAEKLGDVESLPDSVKNLALIDDDLSTLREECQAVVGTSFQMPEKIITPKEIPSLRAAVRRDVEAAFVAVKSAYDDVDPDDKELSSLSKSASDRHEDLNKDPAGREKNFAAFLVLFSKIQDPGFGRKTSLPVASTGDDVEIRFDNCLTSSAVQATGADGCDASKATTILIIPIVGQRQPSFSTGIFFTGLDDPSYFKAQDGKIQANAEDRFSPVLGALIHTPLIFFGGPNLSAPLSFGVALKDNNPVYLLGLSFIIGRNERSVLTLGMAGGQVTRLSGAELGDPTKSDQPPTRKVFRTRPMIGFTYNFGKQQ